MRLLENGTRAFRHMCVYHACVTRIDRSISQQPCPHIYIYIHPLTRHPLHPTSHHPQLNTATYVDGIALPPEWGRMKMYRIDREQTEEEQAAAQEEDAEEGGQQESDFSWRVCGRCWGLVVVCVCVSGAGCPAVSSSCHIHTFIQTLFLKAPFVMSFFREADQTVLVVVRGTIYDREWQRDFECVILLYMYMYIYM